MIRWTKSLLESTYGPARYGVHFAPFEQARPTSHSQDSLDPEMLEKARAVAREFEKYEFFMTHFDDPATDASVWNLLVGTADDVLVVDFAILIPESAHFLAEFDIAKLTEGEPIALVSPGLHFSWKPFPFTFLGSPRQR